MRHTFFSIVFHTSVVRCYSLKVLTALRMGIQLTVATVQLLALWSTNLRPRHHQYSTVAYKRLLLAWRTFVTQAGERIFHGVRIASSCVD